MARARSASSSGGSSDASSSGSEAEAEAKRRKKKEERKERKKEKKQKKRKQQQDDEEEGARLQKKLRKLLKRQRQQQQQQQQQQQRQQRQQQQQQQQPQQPPPAPLPPSIEMAGPGLPVARPRPAVVAKPAFVPAIPSSVAPTQEELWRRAERARRFAQEVSARNSGGGGGAPAAAASSSSSSSSSSGLGRAGKGAGAAWRGAEEEWGVVAGGNGRGPLVGACTVVERDYTRTVEAREVRPVPVLEEALRRAQAHWARHEDYARACSRLKSIRQDLRVQHVETRFTVKVYETHARVALEDGDLNEFLLCAARLDELRGLGLPTSADEFAAYRLLHTLYTGDPLGLRAALLAVRAPLKNEGGTGKGRARGRSLADEGPVRHALEVLRAHVQGNYHRFFRLYQNAPHMSAYLMDFLLLRNRRAAIEAAMSAYGPTALPLAFLAHELAFDDEAECRAFAVGKMGCVPLPEDPSCLDTRASRRALLGSPKGVGAQGGVGKKREKGGKRKGKGKEKGR